jgi:hypothetical protein
VKHHRIAKRQSTCSQVRNDSTDPGVVVAGHFRPCTLAISESGSPTVARDQAETPALAKAPDRKELTGKSQSHARVRPLRLKSKCDADAASLGAGISGQQE